LVVISVTDQWIDAWLGAPRFQKYVDACNGDRARALALYEWNVTLGQALMRDIAHFEIALRNSYDFAISSQWKGLDHWLLDPESPAVTPIWRIRRDRTGLKRGTDVNYRNRRSVDAAIEQCGGVKSTAGKVIAELSFGFWSHLTNASHEKTLWVPYLHLAYPPKTSRSNVDRIVSNINKVRNRIAHHEPVFDGIKTPELEPSKVHAGLLHVSNMIAPDVATYLLRTSTVTTIISSRP
jgi:hypothetical protein